MIKNLPERKKKELDSAFKSSKNKKEANRIQAIRLLSKGRTHKDVGEVTGYTDIQIQKLVTRYNKKGLGGLKLAPHPKNNSKLSPKQKDQVKDILAKFKTPLSVGLKVRSDDNFWSVDTLRTLLKKKFHMGYQSRGSYVDLLKYCGYTYQKVEFEDERKVSEQTADFKKRFTGKLKKGGRFSMWW